jgi:8-oxo-dGTP diphosphatase
MKHTTLLFLLRENQILLAMKKRGFGVGKWNGAGGKLEPSETPEQGAIRECQEEISVTPRDIQLVGNMHFFDLPDVEHFCHIYTTTEWEGEPAETEEMRPQWFDISDIPYDDMWADDRLWLPEMLAGNFFKARVVVENDRIREWRLEGVEPGRLMTSSQPDATFAEVSREIWQHLIDRDWDNPAARSLAISLSLEANELLEHYQWGETPVGDKAALAEELADIFICALQYARILGVEPPEIIRDKLAKSAQKYPAEQFKGQSKETQRANWMQAKVNHRAQKEGL